jgi:hypothetical protein
VLLDSFTLTWDLEVTIDGGRSFKSVLADKDLRSVGFATDTTWLVLGGANNGEASTLYRTTNGGRSWQFVKAPLVTATTTVSRAQLSRLCGKVRVRQWACSRTIVRKLGMLAMMVMTLMLTACATSTVRPTGVVTGVAYACQGLVVPPAEFLHVKVRLYSGSSLVASRRSVQVPSIASRSRLGRTA